MDAYERKIIRGIYEAACMGNRKALRILENLTTKQRRRGYCPICGKRVKRKVNKYCSVHCQALAPRKNRRKRLSLEDLPCLQAKTATALQPVEHWHD